MSKSLKSFMEVAEPKSEDEKNFKDKHITVKHGDRNGNDDSLFKGKTKKDKSRDADYKDGEDEEVYEAVRQGFSFSGKSEKGYNVQDMGKAVKQAVQDIRRGTEFDDAVEKASKSFKVDIKQLHKQVSNKVPYQTRESIEFDSYADMIEELYDTADAEEKAVLDELLETNEGLMELISIMEEEEEQLNEGIGIGLDGKKGQKVTVMNKYDDHYYQTGKIIEVPKRPGGPYVVKFKDGSTNEYGGVELK